MLLLALRQGRASWSSELPASNSSRATEACRPPAGLKQEQASLLPVVVRVFLLLTSPLRATSQSPAKPESAETCLGVPLSHCLDTEQTICCRSLLRQPAKAAVWSGKQPSVIICWTPEAHSLLHSQLQAAHHPAASVALLGPQMPVQILWLKMSGAKPAVRQLR